jgi:UPF0176 protein
MTTASILNIAAYRFAALTDLGDLREHLRVLARAAQLKGTILLSAEGINLFIAGSVAGVGTLLNALEKIPGLQALEVKRSYTDAQPFRRLLVRIKKEIIAFGVPGIDPAQRQSAKLSPLALKQWLDEGRSVTLLDTRNDYEVKLGTFRNARTLDLQHSRDAPRAVARRVGCESGDRHQARHTHP